MPLRLPPIRPRPVRGLPRWEASALLALHGWQGLPLAEQRRLNLLYWGPVTEPWPPSTIISTTDHEEGERREDLLVPSMEGGPVSARSAPIVRSWPDNQTPNMVRSFVAFWRFWIEEGRPVKALFDTVPSKVVSGAPLMKVMPPKKEKGRAPAGPR